MSEQYIDTHEQYEPRLETVGFANGGVSAIIMDQPGDMINLGNSQDKYLRTPDRTNDPMGVYIKGHTDDGETVFLVVNNNYAVAFGKRNDGRQFAEVSHVTAEDLAMLREDLVIGEESRGFSTLIVDVVGAAYKEESGGATRILNDHNPFTIAAGLVEKAKERQSQKGL